MIRKKYHIAAGQRQTQLDLMNWYAANKRPLPWRANQDPYHIWISEVMLQQTTVTAVIPFFDRFFASFKTIQALAAADEADVLKAWSGLGYYSRARNIHRAAKVLSVSGFSKFSKELSELPGFGPYTSRAVSSICFEEKVGVLDGNVIRVLTRYFGFKVKWWQPKERVKLQHIADQLAQLDKPSIWNQAMMELGASICSPKRPACLLCPLKETCNSFKRNLTAKLPLLRPRKSKEIWLWRAQIMKKKNKILLVKNNYAPFLKNQWLPPGEALLQSKPPKKFLFKHLITHHEIYVVETIAKMSTLKPAQKAEDWQWVDRKKLSGISPTSLVAKLLELS